jgi:hypothetical protein
MSSGKSSLLNHTVIERDDNPGGTNR